MTNYQLMGSTTVIQYTQKHTGTVTHQPGETLFLQTNEKCSKLGLFYYRTDVQHYWKTVNLEKVDLTNVNPISPEDFKEIKATIVENIISAPRLAIILATGNDSQIVKAFKLIIKPRVQWPTGSVAHFDKDVPFDALKKCGVTSKIMDNLIEKNVVVKIS